MFPISLQGRVRNPRRSLVNTAISSWGNFSPLALRPLVWLDAADTTTITSASGLVSQWSDKSGNARHATQATALLQPTTGSNTQNGLNVLTFTDHVLLTSTFSQAQPVTIFVAAGRSSTDSVNRQVIGNETTTPSIYTDGNTWRIFAGTVLNSTQSSSNTNFHYFAATFNGTASVLRRNGSQIASGNAGTSGYSTKAVNIGGPATFRWQGYVGEVIVTPALVEARDVAVVESYLKNKWGV